MKKPRAETEIKITFAKPEHRWSGSIFDPTSEIMTVCAIKVEWKDKMLRTGIVTCGENLPEEKIRLMERRLLEWARERAFKKIIEEWK